jgi:hypothetical protein
MNGHAEHTQASPAPRKVGRGYLLSLFVGLGGAFGLFIGLLAYLDHSENLPPPAFTNSLCVDEKLKYLREREGTDPNLLVVGSSVAWRHVDTSLVRNQSPTIEPLNGAFCGLRANQSTYVADWLIDREPSVRTVVMVVDPQDFAGCTAARTEIFSREDADRYVYGHASPWPYYLRYFEPRSLLRNAMSVKTQRGTIKHWDPLVFTAYGDGPLNPRGDRGLHYAAPDPLDDQCFAALSGFARNLQLEGRSLLLVSTPLHPDWKRRHDPNGALLETFDQRLLAALKGTPARYWNADRHWKAPADAFVDAIHMRWPAAQQFSAALAQNIAAVTDPGPEKVRRKVADAVSIQ